MLPIELFNSTSLLHVIPRSLAFHISFVVMSRELTVTQRTALAYVSTATGSLSIFGSALIVRKVLKRKKETTTTYHRLLLGMSIMDIMFSFWKALGTLPVTPESGAIGAHGTTATCSAAGFFAQWGVIPPIYMASLSLYFLLKIRFNISDTDMTKRYEVFLHGFPWLLGLATSTAGLALQIFNPIALPELGCWINGAPKYCAWIPDLECKRGYKVKELISIYPWLFAYGWLFLAFFIVLVSNTMIYVAIRQQERKNDRYRHRPSISDMGSVGSAGSAAASNDGSSRRLSLASATEGSRSFVASKRTSITMQFSRAQRSGSITSTGGGPNTTKSRAALVQSMYYVVFAFFIAVWMWLPWLGSELQVRAEVRAFLAFGVQIFYPLQGLFNFFVYVRPKFIRLRKENHLTRLKAVKRCICDAP